MHRGVQYYCMWKFVFRRVLLKNSCSLPYTCPTATKRAPHQHPKTPINTGLPISVPQTQLQQTPPT